LQDRRGLEATVAERDVLEADATLEGGHRQEAAPVLALLRLLDQNVGEPVQQHRRALPVVPQQEHEEDRLVREGEQGVEGDECADGEVSGHDLARAHPQEQDAREQRHDTDRALVEQDGEVRAEAPVADAQEL
jgi:hypothetical protein